MFGEFVEARAGEAGRKSWAMLISMAVLAAVLLALLLAPLLYTAALPNFVLNMKSFLAPAVYSAIRGDGLGSAFAAGHATRHFLRGDQSCGSGGGAARGSAACA
jgi:hypothetical protein